MDKVLFFIQKCGVHNVYIWFHSYPQPYFYRQKIKIDRNSSSQVFAFTAKAVRTYKGWEESGLFAEGKPGIGQIPQLWSQRLNSCDPSDIHFQVAFLHKHEDVDKPVDINIILWTTSFEFLEYLY